MKRGEMIYCADITLTQFKNLKQRDQLPFVDEDLGDVQLGGNSYTLDHAFRLRLMADMNGGDAFDGPNSYDHKGIPPSYAQMVISNALLRFPHHPLSRNNQLDQWAGVLILEQEGEEGPIRFSSWYAGPLGDLSAWVEKASTEYGFTSVPVRLFIANASLAARKVRDRAIDKGLLKSTEMPEFGMGLL